MTVLVVAYNHADTIARALDSVLSQKTTLPYQIWIADDCSTDGTLEICQRYARKYPDKIRLITQPENTKARHLPLIFFEIATAYYGVLEGDDYWCDDDKMQLALEFLESNPEYMTFAHDTLYDDKAAGTKVSLVHDIHKKKIRNPVNFEDAPYLHTSARIHRNTANLRRHFAGFQNIGDICLFYIYLNAGPLYYYDKTMSVYTIDGHGMWTKLSPEQQAVSMEKSLYDSNRVLNFERDPFFSAKAVRPRLLRLCKLLLGKQRGWLAYIKANKAIQQYSSSTK